MTGLPEIVGLTNVAALAVKEPVKVLLLSVCALAVPTTSPSPLAIP